eukprot:GAHX01003146.1.p1 GENE.GAHX01003146.1~~GAHX01003146.1.p1  ORF type:complete len:395 (-),score=76.53 GAHX01003146.1:31-1215(-)
MKKFKAVTRNHNTNTKSNLSKRKRNTKYIIFSFIFFIALIISIPFILYLTVLRHNPSLSTNQIQSENNTTNLISTTSQQGRGADTNTSILLNKFKEQHIYLLSKTALAQLNENTEDTIKEEEFLEAVIDYSQKISPVSYTTYNNMTNLESKIDEHLSAYIYNPNLSDIDKREAYNKVLYVYTNILKTALGEFITRKQHKTHPELSILDLIGYRLIYQQLHLRFLLKTVIKISSLLKNTIVEHLNVRLNSNPLKELLEHFCVFFEKNKESIFEERERLTGIRLKGKNVTVNYLLSSVQNYHRFLILNLYIVFMHIFEINAQFEVIGINEYFNEFILGTQQKELNENDIVAVNKMVIKCRKILIQVMETEKKNEFIDLEKNIYEECVTYLFDNINI